jgi:hypothetical protein
MLADVSGRKHSASRLAEGNAQLDLTEKIARIAAPPTNMDLQGVFAEVAASAARLCDAYDATIFQVDGDLLRRVANYGSIPTNDTLPLTREVVTGRAVLDGRTIQVIDEQAETGEYPEGSERARRIGHRTILAVPLMRAGEALGAISIRRTKAHPFTDRQIDLLKTFADQAVIAIGNTRLFEAEQARTRELSVALQRQTATSEILGIISASRGKLEPVFDAILERARELCAARFGHLLLFDGQTLRPAALHNVPRAYAEFWHSAPPLAFPETLVWRLRETKQPYQLEDTRLGARRHRHAAKQHQRSYRGREKTIRRFCRHRLAESHPGRNWRGRSPGTRSPRQSPQARPDARPALAPRVVAASRPLPPCLRCGSVLD